MCIRDRSNTDHKAYVVVAKDPVRNALVVAFDSPEAPGLWGTSFALHDIHWINPPSLPTELEKGAALPLLARPRYRDPAVPALLTLDPAQADRATVVFSEPQRALAPGQIVAFYDGERLLGGAVYA